MSFSRSAEYEIDVSYEKWTDEDREIGEASESDWYITSTAERLSDVPDELPGKTAGFYWQWDPYYNPDDIYPGPLLEYTDNESTEALEKGITTTYHAFITRDGKTLTRDAIQELGEKLGLKAPPWEKKAMTTKHIAWSKYDLENAAVISEEQRGISSVYNLSIESKYIGTYDDVDEALEVFNKIAEKDHYYPNLFYVNERGNIDMIDYEGNIIQDEEAEMRDQDILSEDEDHYAAIEREAMDPNAAWRDAVDIAEHILFGMTEGDDIQLFAEDLAEKVTALNEWLQKGGFAPDAWKKASTNRTADYQDEAEDVVEKSNPRNIPDFGYHGDLPLGETWAYTISVNRDSGLLDQSNWEVITNDMETRFPNDVAIERASHWAVGWVDYLAVRMLDDSGKVTVAGKALIDWVKKLEGYPIADEEHWSEKEHEYAGESIDREISAILDDNEIAFTEADVENVYQWLRENTGAIDYVLEDPENNSLDRHEDDVLAAAHALGLAINAD